MAHRILIVDDDEPVRDAFMLALSGEAEYGVVAAASGDEGLKLAAMERPDLVFLDLNMPGLNGVQVLHRLLEADATLNVYIVTAFQRDYLAELGAARAEGLTFELARKPLSAEQIRTIVRGVLGGGAVEDSAPID
jgi:two-component system nitrate/nitrite response regulator NarL